jgi:hypothetical protein
MSFADRNVIPMRFISNSALENSNVEHGLKYANGLGLTLNNWEAWFFYNNNILPPT